MHFIEGIPFVKLTGTYYEMGLQYGILFKKQLSEIRTKMASFYPKLVPWNDYKLIKKNIPTKYQDFLIGVAQSSSIPYEDLLVDSFYETMNTGCSSVLARIGTGSSNDLFLAKNKDANHAITYQAVIEYNPNSGYRYIVTATIGAIFIHQGMNEKGISITGNTAPSSDYQPSMFFKDDIFRVLLESADSLKKVDQIINEYQSDYDEIISVGSGPDNNGAIYDISHIKRVKHELINRKYLYVTNKFLDDALSSPVIRYSCPRYRAIDNYAQHHDIASINDLIELLSLDNVNNSGTVHSIIFNPQKKELYMAFSTHYAARSKWLKYNWDNDAAVLFKKLS